MIVGFIAVLVLGGTELAKGATISIGPGPDCDFNTIQAGIDAANDGDTVLVAPGEYVITVPITFRGKAITVKSEAGPDETTIRMGTPADTNRGSVVIFESGETIASVLEGFTITGSRNGSWVPSHSVWGGGGILFNASSGTVRNCMIVKNSTGHGGGVASAYAGSPILVDCIISENSTSGGGGGGVFAWSCSPTLIDCIINRNSSESEGDLVGGVGGGLSCGEDASVTVIRCAIVGNTATKCGGGVYVDAFATLTNCVIAKNTARLWGGGGVICSYPDSSIAIGNCTIWGNSGGFSCPPNHQLWGGGGVLSRQGSVTVANSIIRGNTSPKGPELSVFSAGELSITFSNVADGQTGVNVEGGCNLSWSKGNIDADPLLVRLGYLDDKGTRDPSDDVWVDGDYHLKSQGGRWDPDSQTWVQDDVTSPCIDAGDPMSPIGWESFPNGGFVNMGAYGGTSKASKSYFGEPVCETIVAGDINGDGQVNRADLEIMALHWTDEVPLPLP
jgi:hypothetical protein